MAATSSNELGALIKEKLDAFASKIEDEREQIIWERRLTEADPASLAVLGEQFGVSKERVRQLEVRALKKLRKLLDGDEAAMMLAAA